MSSCSTVQVYHGGGEAKIPLGDASQTSLGFVLLVHVCWLLLAALWFRKHSPGTLWSQGRETQEIERHNVVTWASFCREYHLCKGIWGGGVAGACGQSSVPEQGAVGWISYGGCFMISNTVYHTLFLQAQGYRNNAGPPGFSILT